MATIQVQAALPAGTQIPVDVIVQPADTHRKWWVAGISTTVVVALALSVFLVVHQTDSATIKAAVASAQAEAAAREAAIKVATDTAVAKATAEVSAREAAIRKAAEEAAAQVRADAAAREAAQRLATAEAAARASYAAPAPRRPAPSDTPPVIRYTGQTCPPPKGTWADGTVTPGREGYLRGQLGCWRI